MFKKIKEFFKDIFSVDPEPIPRLKSNKYKSKYDRYFSLEVEYWLPDYTRRYGGYPVLILIMDLDKNLSEYPIYEIEMLSGIGYGGIKIKWYIFKPGMVYYKREFNQISYVAGDSSEMWINRNQFNIIVGNKI